MTDEVVEEGVPPIVYKDTVTVYSKEERFDFKGVVDTNGPFVIITHNEGVSVFAENFVSKIDVIFDKP